MQATIDKFQGEVDAIVARVTSGEIGFDQAHGELMTLLSRSIVSIVRGGMEGKEWVMPSLGADGLIGRHVMIKVKKRSPAVADSALYLHKTGSTASDLRSFRPDLILKKAANRQKYKCGAVADAALWLFVNTDVNADGLIRNDRADILEALRILGAEERTKTADAAQLIFEACWYFTDGMSFDVSASEWFDAVSIEKIREISAELPSRARRTVSIADKAQWLFQHVSFYTDASMMHARAASEQFERMTVRDVSRVYENAVKAYDEARTKVADAAWYLVEADQLLPDSPKHLIDGAHEHNEARRILAGQAWWLFDVERWTQYELIESGCEFIKRVQSQSFMQFQSARLKTADAAEFLYMFGRSDQATLKARMGEAIRIAASSQIAHLEATRTATADKAWALHDNGYGRRTLEQLIELNVL